MFYPSWHDHLDQITYRMLATYIWSWIASQPVTYVLYQLYVEADSWLKSHYILYFTSAAEQNIRCFSPLNLLSACIAYLHKSYNWHLLSLCHCPSGSQWLWKASFDHFHIFLFVFQQHLFPWTEVYYFSDISFYTVNETPFNFVLYHFLSATL